ncbi:MAG TPA: ABC transporter permease [Thermoanaerobaculia bacterium]|nr:ABC transporter permease [Thermoanaerobaculia bacterium]
MANPAGPAIPPLPPTTATPPGGTRLTGWLEAAGADLRFGARLLARSPGFTAVAVLTLALGIGANTAIFSVVDSVLLRPLPYRPGGEVVVLGEEKPCCEFAPTAPANLLDYQRYSHDFEQLAGINFVACVLARRGAAPLSLKGSQVTSNYFAVFGISAGLGRTLEPAIERPGAPGAAVLSDRVWRQHFGAEPSAIGGVVLVDSQPYTVVGVMPERFSRLSSADLWVSSPFATLVPGSDRTGKQATSRDINFIRPIGRLRAGIGLDQARSELLAISQRLTLEHPEDNAKKVALLRPLRDWVVGGAGPALWVLLGAVGLILLIACSNLANLLLARGTAREREMALRAALGAGRLRLVRQLLTETLLLGIMGGGLGLLLAAWGVHLLSVLRPGNLPRAEEVRISATVLAFTLAVSLLAALLSGLAPALRALRVELGSALKQGGRGTSGGGQRLRRVLVIAEIAMSLALLIGAGLLIRSFSKLLGIAPGFVAQGVVAADLPLNQERYRSLPQVTAFAGQLLARVAALPGVEAAGIVDAVPFGNSSTDGDIQIAGRPAARAGEGIDAQKRITSGGYFRTLGIPLLRGRTFDDRDAADGPPVVIVNENLARFAWPGQDPVGKQLKWDDGADAPWLTVVGVVGNLHMFRLDDKPTLDAYRPYRQYRSSGFTLVVRRAANPLGLAGQLRQEVLALDRLQPISRIDLLTEMLDRSLALRRFQLGLIGSLALLALVLASLGVYGVVSYSVRQRTREIGVRVALGARRAQVFALVLRGSLAMTAAGLAAGILGSLVLGRFVESLLYGIGSHDPAVYAAAAGALLGVSLFAAYLPARRAAEIDPAVTLQAE